MEPKTQDTPIGGDPLQVDADFGASQRLVKISRRRFQRNKTPELLIQYQTIMLEVAVHIMSMEHDATEEREWFMCEHKKLQEALTEV